MGTAYIVDAVRTPRGRGKKGAGRLSGLHERHPIVPQGTIVERA